MGPRLRSWLLILLRLRRHLAVGGRLHAYGPHGRCSQTYGRPIGFIMCHWFSGFFVDITAMPLGFSASYNWLGLNFRQLLGCAGIESASWQKNNNDHQDRHQWSRVIGRLVFRGRSKSKESRWSASMILIDIITLNNARYDQPRPLSKGQVSISRWPAVVIWREDAVVTAERRSPQLNWGDVALRSSRGHRPVSSPDATARAHIEAGSKKSGLSSDPIKRRHGDGS